MSLIQWSQSQLDEIKQLMQSGVKFLDPNGNAMMESQALQKLAIQQFHRHVGGLIRQAEDPRDKVVSAPIMQIIPSAVDLGTYESPIEDQGNIGSCFANAVAGALELIDKRKGTFGDLSRLFIFYNTHYLEGSVGVDDGCTIRDSVKSANKWGTCLESEWPYNISQMWARPTDQCYADAANHRITQYQSVQGSLDVYKSLLAQGYPLVGGFEITDYFLGPQCALSGICVDPPDFNNPGNTYGHAMVYVGYDDNKKVNGWHSPGGFKLRNSWSSAWGIQGHVWVSYEFAQYLGFDTWVLINDI